MFLTLCAPCNFQSHNERESVNRRESGSRNAFASLLPEMIKTIQDEDDLQKLIETD